MNQETALNILKSGVNVFLTGSAGAGKTYTLNQYIAYLKARRVPVAITASTGIAATHMNGMTIHTWSGIGIKDSLDSKDLKRMAERKYLRKHLDAAQVLIIDEISMLHAKQFNMVNEVLTYFKDNPAAFGGIQLVVSGDFFQLPPVSKTGEANRDKFAFMSPAWVEAGFKVCYLTEQHRQQPTNDNNVSDNKQLSLNSILNQLRQGQISQQAINTLVASKHHQLAADATRLYTHNIDVDAINQQQLAQLKGKAFTYTAQLDGNEKLLMTLSNSVRAPEHLTLKKGAKVMFVKNNFDQGTFNGTLAEIIDFVPDDEYGTLPEVRLTDGAKLVVLPETWSIDNEAGKPIATYTQLPLCYAWAITVHKSQGMTLEAAEIDLSHTFEAGQGYVALSRLKHLAGLRLLGLNQAALQLDPLAMKADKRFLELSVAAEQHGQTFTKAELKEMHQAFIKKCGGTLNTYIINQNEKRLKKGEKASYNASTLAETLALLQESLSIAEIAQMRELAESTIVNHIAKLLQDEPKLPIEHIKPDAQLIKQVQQVYNKLKAKNNPEHFADNGDMKLKPIFDALNETIPYNHIRLALLFIR